MRSDEIDVSVRYREALSHDDEPTVKPYNVVWMMNEAASQGLLALICDYGHHM